MSAPRDQLPAHTDRGGFTLIEVMIAVVILAVGLTSLFTSEAGAMRIAQRARTTTVATLLARCKMAEIEERIGKEGWPGAQIDGRDECCDEAEHDGFRCEWKVERITLPEIDAEEDDKPGGVKDRIKAGATGGASDGKSKLAGGAGGALAGLGGPGGAVAGLGGAGGALAGMGAPGGTSGLGAPGGLGGTGATGGTGGVSEILNSIGATEGTGGGGGDPFAAMVIEMTFPVMKPVIEESVRKATVTVSWKEGSSEQKFDVVQFLVNEMPLLPDEDLTDNLTTGGGTAGTAGASTINPTGTLPSTSTSTSTPGSTK